MWFCFGLKLLNFADICFLFWAHFTRDFNSLREEDIIQNNQLAFDLAEREFGISPTMTGKEMSEMESPDKLTMVAYISRFYDLFKDELPPPLKGMREDWKRICGVVKRLVICTLYYIFCRVYCKMITIIMFFV